MIEHAYLVDKNYVTSAVRTAKTVEDLERIFEDETQGGRAPLRKGDVARLIALHSQVFDVEYFSKKVMPAEERQFSRVQKNDNLPKDAGRQIAHWLENKFQDKVKNSDKGTLNLDYEFREARLLELLEEASTLFLLEQDTLESIVLYLEKCLKRYDAGGRAKDGRKRKVLLVLTRAKELPREWVRRAVRSGAGMGGREITTSEREVALDLPHLSGEDVAILIRYARAREDKVWEKVLEWGRRNKMDKVVHELVHHEAWTREDVRQFVVTRARGADLEEALHQYIDRGWDEVADWNLIPGEGWSSLSERFWIHLLRVAPRGVKNRHLIPAIGSLDLAGRERYYKETVPGSHSPNKR